MKKRLTLLMLAAMGLSLASCDLVGNTENPGTDPGTGEQKPPVIEDVEYTFGSFSNPVQAIYENGSAYMTEVADPSVVRGDDGYLYIFSTLGRVLRTAIFTS